MYRPWADRCRAQPGHAGPGTRPGRDGTLARPVDLRLGDVELWNLSDDDLAAVSPHLTPSVREVLSVAGSLASRNAVGGTAPVRVAEQLDAARAALAALREWTTLGAA